MTTINVSAVGSMARQAGRLCKAKGFHRYLDQAKRTRHGIHHNALPDGSHQLEDATDFIHKACGVQANSEIDHDEKAAHMLRRIITDYRRWQSARGLAQREAMT